jgi:hypothetical protein
LAGVRALVVPMPAAWPEERAGSKTASREGGQEDGQAKLIEMQTEKYKPIECRKRLDKGQVPSEFHERLGPRPSIDIDSVCADGPGQRGQKRPAALSAEPGLSMKYWFDWPRRVSPDEETIDWRAVCGRTARTVRREGWPERAIPTPMCAREGATAAR